jgi:hypothetical protein
MRAALSASTHIPVLIPFCARPLSAVSDGGSEIVLLRQENTAARTGVFNVLAVSTSGDTIFSRQYRYIAIPIPPQSSDSAWNRLIRVRAQRFGSASIDSTAIPTRAPPTYPPVRRIVVGRDSSVWLELRTTRQSHRWLRLDRHGSPDALVDLPPYVTVEAATAARLWGVERDPVDHRQNIVRYRVSHAR